MSVNLLHLLIDIENQRHYNSCVGQAISTYMEAIWKKFDGSAKEFSPAFVWQHNKTDPTANKGLSTERAMLQLKKVGICLESTFPYVDDNLTIKPPPAAYKEAKKHRIGSWKSLRDPDEMKFFLDKGLPCIFAIRFPNVDVAGIPLEQHPDRWRKAEASGGYHEMVCMGYDGDNYLIVNSWGSWGAGGLTLIPSEELRRRGFNGDVVTGLKWQWLKTAKKWFKNILKIK